MLFKDYYQKAPEKIKESVDSSGTAAALAEIAKKGGVGDEGLGNKDLGKLVGQILVGMLHPKDFVPALVEKLNIPRETAQDIAKEVNKEVFAPVKDILIKIHGLEKRSQQTKEEAITVKPPEKQDVDPKKEKPSVGKMAMLKPPQKEQTAVPTTPQPHMPKPPEKTGFANNSTIPKPPQKKSVGADVSIPSVPQKKDNEVSASQKERNPFEEKLKQTFTIPKKTSVPAPPQTPATPQDIEISEKKAAVKKDPYLETVE